MALAGTCVGVDVFFTVSAETSFGDKVCVVGAADTLGSWDTSRAVLLDTEAHTYPLWFGRAFVSHASLMEPKDVEFKFIIQRADGSVVWEEGPNRSMHLLHATVTSATDSPTYPRVFHFGQTGQETLMAELQFLGEPKSVSRQGSTSSTCSPDPDCDDEAHSVAGAVSQGDASTCLPWAESVENSEEAFLWSGAVRLQKPGGQCEDAYFFSSRALGVADGVGQMVTFAKHGVDAAAYAAELMELAAKALLSDERGAVEDGAGGNGTASCSPSTRAASAIAAAQAGAETFGASTVTVAAVENNLLGVANLGDSGCMLLRRKDWGMEVVERSFEQSHSWNCPYQLTRVPEALVSMGQGRFDTVDDCQLYQWPVQHGDLIVLFTDGLSDNLHWFEITNIINETLGFCADDELGLATPATQPEDVARALALAAKARSGERDADTPFARNARRHRMSCPGGKVDDITVVAAWVTAGCQDGMAGRASASLAHRMDEARTLVL
mmetsp:Transcript_31234/g.85747  ORF Transcript_31234/g.85747 Transcript_31234/m.85747 type:complete len:496 (+) Transcript_31234:106-1593(+)